MQEVVLHISGMIKNMVIDSEGKEIRWPFLA